MGNDGEDGEDVARLKQIMLEGCTDGELWHLIRTDKSIRIRKHFWLQMKAKRKSSKFSQKLAKRFRDKRLVVKLLP